MSVHPLPVSPIDLRACPSCGFRVLLSDVIDMRINPWCPECGKHRFSEFLPVRSGA